MIDNTAAKIYYFREWRLMIPESEEVFFPDYYVLQFPGGI